VGEAYDLNSFKRAFIWTSSIGVQDLGTPIFPNDSSHNESEAYGISANGSLIAGRAIPTQSSLIPQAFQFQTTPIPASFSFLPFPPNGFQSDADAVSAGGTVEAGTSFDNSSAAHAVRWQGGTVLDLTPTGNGVASNYATSADGSAVVGTFSVTGCCYHAFRWTAATGLKDLGSF
jgi:probable HAF family extracellular repeat protein